MKDRECLINIFVNLNFCSDIVIAHFICRDLQLHAFKADAIAVVDLSIVLLAQDVTQGAVNEVVVS